MKGTAFLWVGPAPAEVTFRSLRTAGLFPVEVRSAEQALHLLTQFRVQLVLLRIDKGDHGWHECARMLASGTPVAVLVDAISPESAPRYLNAGCAAVIDARCTSTELTAAVARLAAGERGILCPPDLVRAAS